MKAMWQKRVQGLGVGLVVAGVACWGVGCKSKTGTADQSLLGRPSVPPPYAQPAPASVSVPVQPAEPVVTPPPVAPAVTPQPTTPAVAPAPAALPKPVTSKVLTHRVAKGETLWSIARAYGVSQEELAARNDMKLSETLAVGRELKVPEGGRFVPPEKRPVVKPAPKPKAVAKPRAVETGKVAEPVAKAAKLPVPTDGKYVVKEGDSLSTIAYQFGLKTDDVRRYNGLKSDFLRIGQVLTLIDTGAAAGPAAAAPVVGAPEEAAPPAVGPAPAGGVVAPVEATPPPAAGAAPEAPKAGTAPAGAAVQDLPKTLEHQVIAGDTLQTIANIYQVKVDDVKKANPQIKSDADLTPNTVLIIPYR